MPIHESESSLPSQPASAQFHSSPPIFDPNQIFGPMESHQEVKLDPDTGVGDGHTHTRASSADTERPPNSAQRIANQDEIGEPADGNHEEAIEEEEEEDPADKIADFDWDGLHERYHAAIDKCAENETKLMQEFESLMNVLATHSIYNRNPLADYPEQFFKVWADSGHTHETNRTYSR